MPWNPELYNQFKDIRYKPFYDLLGLLKDYDPKTIIDLGCGTGEQTAILTRHFKEASVLGIDSSPTMLAQARDYHLGRLTFRHIGIEEILASGQQWDLVFSNAALQWVDGHEKLFKQLVSVVNPGGQLAVQVPVQDENKLNQLLLQLVKEEPFSNYLQGFLRESPVLALDAYAQLLFDEGLLDLDISMRVYPIIAEDPQELVDFISGSAMIPYLERLKSDQAAEFTEAFKQRVAAAWPKFPAIYAFKRLLLVGTKRG
ncbi:methyltransferase domain-containing protein [Sphingobacterium lactis]|uniref:methyltransferase domain-containing protein n=1 Tax=Sphingobacterium lactis TaxID=797291 RepID=UPI003EC5506D